MDPMERLFGTELAYASKSRKDIVVQGKGIILVQENLEYLSFIPWIDFLDLSIQYGISIEAMPILKSGSQFHWRSWRCVWLATCVRRWIIFEGVFSEVQDIIRCKIAREWVPMANNSNLKYLGFHCRFVGNDINAGFIEEILSFNYILKIFLCNMNFLNRIKTYRFSI